MIAAARELFASYQVGEYVFARSPGGYRRLARIMSASSQKSQRRTLWLVRVRYTARWHDKGEWLPVERLLVPAEVALQKRLGFIGATGEPS